MNKEGKRQHVEMKKIGMVKEVHVIPFFFLCSRTSKQMQNPNNNLKHQNILKLNVYADKRHNCALMNILKSHRVAKPLVTGFS